MRNCARKQLRLSLLVDGGYGAIGVVYTYSTYGRVTPVSDNQADDNGNAGADIVAFGLLGRGEKTQ